MKRILQKSAIGVALALALAAAVPAMAASTCSTSACPSTLSKCLSNSQSYQDCISKLAACGMNADQLRLCGTPNAGDNTKAAAAVSPAGDSKSDAVLSSVKDATGNYADQSSCPSSAVQSTSTCPTSAVKSASTCPTNSSDIQSSVQKAIDKACSQQSGSSSCPTNSSDVQAAMQKALDKACSQQSGSSSCNSASASDILGALQSSGLTACNK